MGASHHVRYRITREGEGDGDHSPAHLVAELFCRFDADPRPLESVRRGVRRLAPPSSRLHTESFARLGDPYGLAEDDTSPYLILEFLGCEMLMLSLPVAADQTDWLAEYIVGRTSSSFSPRTDDVRATVDVGRHPPLVRGLIDGPLECYRQLYGAVGVYWIAPVLAAMYTKQTQNWRVVSESIVPCRDDGRRCVCDGLPIGADVAVLRMDAREWMRYYNVVRFHLASQCRDAELVQQYYPPRDRVDGADDYRLYCVIAGGVPLATCVVRCHRDWYHIQLLCSATRSNGGRLAVEAVQQDATSRGLRRGVGVVSVPSAEGFYRRMGFVDIGMDLERGVQLVWGDRGAADDDGPPSPKRAKR